MFYRAEVLKSNILRTSNEVYETVGREARIPLLIGSEEGELAKV